MLMLICGFTVIYMFYNYAKKTNKNKMIWSMNGALLWFVLGALFLKITETYILNIQTVADAFSFQYQKILLEIVSAVIIVFTAYFIQSSLMHRQRIK